jgi:hypothetical protein
MTIHENIFIGVFSGVLSYALIALVATAFNHIIIPWYRKLIYSGADISGIWKSTQVDNGIKETLVMEITQKAEHVECLLTITKQISEDAVELKAIKLKGIFQNRFLALNGKNTNRQHLGVNVLLLELVSGGKKMVGYETWYSTHSNTIAYPS